MKKICIFGFLAFLGFAPHVFAQGFTALAPIPGLTDISPTSVLDGNVLAQFFNNLYKYLIGLAATLAVIEIIWAGLDISFFHKDAVGAIVDDKGRIYNAIFGLILVLSPVLVFSIINPSILNLSLNLPPINLNTPAGGVSSMIPSVVDPTSGCTVRSGPYLETAVCPTASNYVCQNGLTPTAGSCVADSAGKCVSGINIYCGKSITVLYYKASYYGVAGSGSSVVPNDAQTKNTFVAGCSANGGTVSESADNGAVLLFDCPASAGVTFTAGNTQTGVWCVNKTLSCKP